MPVAMDSCPLATLLHPCKSFFLVSSFLGNQKKVLYMDVLMLRSHGPRYPLEGCAEEQQTRHLKAKPILRIIKIYNLTECRIKHGMTTRRDYLITFKCDRSFFFFSSFFSSTFSGSALETASSPFATS